jgi:hypothetical protein
MIGFRIAATILAFLVGSIVSAPPSFADGSGGTTLATVFVPATAPELSPAVNSGVFVTPSAPVTVTATGTAYYCPGCAVPPTGWPPGVTTCLTGDPNYVCLAPDLPSFSLVGRLGSGPWIAIGAGPTTLNGNGELILAFNDWIGTYYNNSGGFQVTVTSATSPAPSISSLSPSSTPEGGATFTLTVNGTGFVGNSTVYWNGASRTTSYVSSAQLTAAIAAADITDSGTATVSVTNPAPGGGSSNPAAFTITNAPPVVTPPPDQTADEGTSKAFTLGSFSDPGPDSPWRVDVDWGDGSTHPPFTMTAPGPIPAQSHMYADNGTYKVIVKVTDKDGGQSIPPGSFNVTVFNVLPSNVLVSLNPASINENDNVTLNGRFTDPGTLDTHEVVISWGDGTETKLPPLPAGVLIFEATHRYLDDNPTATASDANQISVRVTDKDGGSGSGTASVTVKNVPPAGVTITAPAFGQLFPAGSVSLSATYTDVGTKDTHTCQIKWDLDNAAAPVAAGTIAEPSGTSAGTCTNSQTLGAGVYTAEVTVKDDDGGTATATVLFVVYDPSAGFVTGGGWLNSPAGAYRADPALSGRANFGFVAKYQRGATTPSGQTEFHFQAGNFSFHSSTYERLVVAGAKAQFTGTGTVNGTAGYNFILTATDGQVSGGGGADKFRIKITGPGGVVYDNVPTAGDDIDSANPQEIAGGSIVIHN